MYYYCLYSISCCYNKNTTFSQVNDVLMWRFIFPLTVRFALYDRNWSNFTPKHLIRLDDRVDSLYRCADFFVFI